MWQKRLPLIFTGGLLAGSCLCFWNQLQDSTFLPRVFFVALWLFLFFPFIQQLFTINEWKADVADALFGIYVGLHFVSIAWAVNTSEAVYESEKMFLVFMAYLALKRVLTLQLVSVLFLLQVLSAICVVYDVFGLLQLQTLLQVALPKGDNLYVINGLAGHKNLYSGFMLMSSFLLAYGIGMAPRLWRFIFGIIVTLQLVLMLVLQTRSVFMAVVVSAVVMLVTLLLVQGKAAVALLKKTALPALAVLVAVIAFGFFTGTIQAFVQRLSINNYLMSDTSIERLSVWYKSYLLLKEHWLLGVGAHNWMVMYLKSDLTGMFRTQYLNMVFLQPHNDLLWVWCELGIFGLLAFVGLFVVMIRAAFKKMRAFTDTRQQRFLLLLGVSQIAFLVFCFFDFPKERMEQQMMLIVSWAFISTICGQYLKAWLVPAKFVRPFLVAAFLLIATGLIVAGVRIKADSYMKPMLEAQDQGRIKEALEYAELMNTPLATLNPQAVPKYYVIGVNAYALGQYQYAYDCFLKAKQYSPYNHSVLNNLGGLQTYFKEYDKALQNYSEALRINPKNDDTRFNVAYTLYFLHRYDEALDTLKKVWSNKARKAEFESIITAARDSATIKK